MPLKSGKSKKVVSQNIKTEMHHYDRTGEMGRGSHPTSRKKAQKQAVAIALSKSREKRANMYLEKISAEVYLRANLNKIKHPKLHTAMGALGGAVTGGAIGGVPGALADNPAVMVGGMAAGALAGGIGVGMRTHKKIKNYNSFVDKLEKHQKKAEDKNIQGIREDLKKHEKSDVVQEKKTNKYLGKLLNMEEKEHEEKIAAHYSIRPTRDMKDYDRIKSVSLNDNEMRRYHKVSDEHIQNNAVKNLGIGTLAGTALGVAGGHKYNKSKIGRRYVLPGKLLGGYIGGVAGLAAGANRVETQAHEKALKDSTRYKDFFQRMYKNGK